MNFQNTFIFSVQGLRADTNGLYLFIADAGIDHITDIWIQQAVNRQLQICWWRLRSAVDAASRGFVKDR